MQHTLSHFSARCHPLENRRISLTYLFTYLLSCDLFKTLLFLSLSFPIEKAGHRPICSRKSQRRRGINTDACDELLRIKSRGGCGGIRPYLLRAICTNAPAPCSGKEDTLGTSGTSMLSSPSGFCVSFFLLFFF